MESVLRLQGISTDTHVGLYEAEPWRALVARVAPSAQVESFAQLDQLVKAARSSSHYVMLVGTAVVQSVVAAIGGDPSTVVAVIAVGADGPSVGTLRAMGVMGVVSDPSEDTLRNLVRRGLELRALRALELAHRCESRRLVRREMDLMGYPPETMTDDLNTFQPPPLPVGPISTYNLEEASEGFERAYIDRVQHLCESAREAAQYLDVSAATLARRTRKEGAGSVNGA